MSSKRVVLSLSDIEFIRVICGKCKTTCELPVAKLAGGDSIYCNGCRRDLIDSLNNLPQGQKQQHPANLAKALEQFGKSTDYEIEFVFPETNSSAKPI